ncbi:hypothetical protein [Cloacibacterium sp.]|uniref:hypothetical protein n=1 Tax=Cloacibacterium sp. TaxID=1913682 RepID=UPI0039E37B92
MKKYFFLIPIVMVSLAITSCRSSDEVETITPTEITSINTTAITNSTEESDNAEQMTESADEKKDPPVKDRQDWRTSN